MKRKSETLDSNINISKIGAYYLVGTMFQKGIAFLTVPIFTRVMGTDDYGLISTYNSWLGILSMFISAALYMSLRLAFVDYKDDIDNFLSSITTFALADGTLFCMVAVAIGILTENSTILVLGVICILQATGEAIIMNLSQYYVMLYRYKTRTILMILPPLLSAVLSIITILLLREKKYLGRIFPTAFVSIIVGILLCLIVYKKSSVILKKEYIIYGIRISAPLILHGIALNILSSSDRIMITEFRNSSETGIYSLVYNVGMLATALTTALDGIWSPWFIQMMNKKSIDREVGTRINFAFREYLRTMTIIMIVIIFVGPEIVKVFADSRYWEGISIIAPIVLANYLIFIYTFYVGVEHYYKKTIFISINTIIAAVVNIILNYIFVPRYGYSAAAYTTLLSYGVSLVLHICRSRRLDKCLFNWKEVLKPVLCVLASAIVFEATVSVFIIRWCIAIGCMFYLITIYRDEIIGWWKRRIE